MSNRFGKWIRTLGDLTAGRPPAVGGEDPARLAAEVVRLYTAGRYKDAADTARRLVEHQRQSLGERHPDFATALSNLGLLLQKQGDLAGAEPHLRQAVDVRRATQGERHPQYAACLVQLAELLQLRGDLPAAEPLLRAALDVLGENGGERHADYATAQTSLGLLKQRRGQLDQALPLLKQALETRRAVLGENHPQYGTALSNLALLLQKRGDLDEAERLFRQALEVRRQALGESHPDHAASQSHLAMLLLARGDREGAEPLLSASIAVRRAALGQSHPEVAADERAMAQVLRARNVEPVEPSEPPPATPPAVVNPPPEPPAPVARTTAELLAAVQGLQSRFARLGAELEEAGRRMRDAGVAPQPRLIGEIQEYERVLQEVREAVSRRTEEAGPDALPAYEPGSRPEGVLALLERVEAIGQLESDRGRREERRRKALTWLDRAAALSHRDPSADSSLPRVHARAVEIRRGLFDQDRPAELTDEARQVAEGSHPIVALLRLVDADEDLPDAEWGRLYRQVERAFGKPLAAASARKRLIIGSRPEADPAAPPRGTSPSQADITDLALGDFQPARKARPTG